MSRPFWAGLLASFIRDHGYSVMILDADAENWRTERTTEIVDFIDYAERIKYQGLNIMNGPGNDLESMTGLVASGATVILFSTGAGTTEGNLIVPTIKIPTTSRVFHRMKEDMDFNAGRLLDEDISLDDLSDELMEMVTEVASGRKICSEIWGKHSFQIWTAGKLSL